MQNEQQQQQQQQELTPQDQTQQIGTALDNIIYNSAYALSDLDLQNWASSNGIDAGIVTLSNLDDSIRKRQNFIFTGSKDDEYNKNNDHHWLVHDGNLLFDSYGAYSDYKLPDNFEFFKTEPTRLQEYNTSVCGAYCCAFLEFLNKQPNNGNSVEDLADEFVAEYGLTSDRVQNDKKIISWYMQTGGKFVDPTPIKRDTSGDTAAVTKEGEGTTPPSNEETTRLDLTGSESGIVGDADETVEY